MKDKMMMEDLFKVATTVEEINSSLFELIVGDEFEVEEMGDGSDEFSDKYDEYKLKEIPYKCFIQYTNSTFEHSRFTLKTKEGVVSVEFLDDAFKVSFKQKEKWKQIFIEEDFQGVLRRVFSFVKEEDFKTSLDINHFVEDATKFCVIENELNNLYALAKLADTLKEKNNTLRSYIDFSFTNEYSHNSMNVHGKSKNIVCRTTSQKDEYEITLVDYRKKEDISITKIGNLSDIVDSIDELLK